MAVLVGTAYLNLEKISSAQSDLLKEIGTLRITIRESVHALDRPLKIDLNGKIEPSPIFNNLKGIFLLYIAKEDRKSYGFWMKVGHWFHVIYRAPGLTYFAGAHKIPIGCLTGFSIISFLALVDRATAGKEALTETVIYGFHINWEWITFWGYTITLLLVFANSLVAHRLQGLPKKCDQFISYIRSLVEAELDSKKSEAEGAINAAAAAIPQNIQPHQL